MSMRNTKQVNHESLVKPSTEQHQTVAVDGVVAFVDFPPDVDYVEYRVGANPIRVTFDGQAPTAAAGGYMLAGATGMWHRIRANAAKFIKVGDASDIDGAPVVN